MRTAISLDERQVQLWRAELDVRADVLASLRRSLSSEERIRADRFRAESDRVRYVAAHGLLRRVLAQYLAASPEELRFAQNIGGKPHVESPGATWLRFSLSHSDGVALIAVARQREVGVDVERVATGPIDDALVQRTLSPREQESLEGGPLHERATTFYVLWTMKEAYAKATGAGLNDPLQHFDAPLAAGESVTMNAVGGTTFTVYAVDPGVNYAAALAVEGSDKGVSTHPRPYP
jgi:4'-phosphopantetheinyl transferase